MHPFRHLPSFLSSRYNHTNNHLKHEGTENPKGCQKSRRNFGMGVPRILGYLERGCQLSHDTMHSSVTPAWPHYAWLCYPCMASLCMALLPLHGLTMHGSVTPAWPHYGSVTLGPPHYGSDCYPCPEKLKTSSFGSCFTSLLLLIELACYQFHLVMLLRGSLLSPPQALTCTQSPMNFRLL